VARAPAWALALELRFPRLGAGRGRRAEALAGQPASPLLSGHVVIAGLGLNGRNVARVLRKVHLPHVAVDLDPESLRLGAVEGSQGLLGDITNPLIQRQAGLSRARVLVLALSDPTATRQACRVARSLSREVFIIVRTRYVAEIDQLYALGANQVIPEEFETSIEIFTAVLREFHVPGNVIQAQIALLRQERYSLLRGRKFPTSVVEQLDAILEQGTTDTFLLLQQSPAVGRTLEELGLLAEGGARAVAVVRGGQAITEFAPDLRLRIGDTLVLTGTHAQMDRVFEELSPPVERLV
jgi:CPA2 family monovalent cation:H+ antiporter-2